MPRSVFRRKNITRKIIEIRHEDFCYSDINVSRPFDIMGMERGVYEDKNR